MTKAERLARELIALSQRYSEHDFVLAGDLLLTGRLFTHAVKTARTARGAAMDTAAKVHRASADRSTKADASQQLDLENLLDDADEAERRELVSFATRFQNREILESGSSARVFARQIGLDLPKTIPERAVLTRALVRRLREIPRDVRSSLILETDRIGTGESSLQRWSDLIVKGGE
jgi:hypothetical protein